MFFSHAREDPLEGEHHLAEALSSLMYRLRVFHHLRNHRSVQSTTRLPEKVGSYHFSEQTAFRTKWAATHELTDEL
jgi:hypothetical protein